MYNATFNNNSVISWLSVSLAEETRRPRENHRPVASLMTNDKFYHILLYTLPWLRFELTTSVVIGIDCIDHCKSNYHVITASTAPFSVVNWTTTLKTWNFKKSHKAFLFFSLFIICKYSLSIISKAFIKSSFSVSYHTKIK